MLLLALQFKMNNSRKSELGILKLYRLKMLTEIFFMKIGEIIYLYGYAKELECNTISGRNFLLVHFHMFKPY